MRRPTDRPTGELSRRDVMLGRVMSTRPYHDTLTLMLLLLLLVIAGDVTSTQSRRDYVQHPLPASDGELTQRDQSMSSSQCVYPCKCPNDPPRCKTSHTVKDGCDCCHICPRQQGDLCDHRDKCDEDRGLHCDFMLDDGHRGICRAKAAKPCDVDGKTYKDGEEFKPNCSLLCTCQNGAYACASLCPQEERAPSRTHCRDAQLVSIIGQCCREWVCPHAHSIAEPDDDAANNVEAERCIRESTAWSACSVTCGMGVSIRVTNDNEQCKSQQQQRLCLIRPCHLDDEQLTSTSAGSGAECRSTWRARQPTKLQYGECQSLKEFHLKYCSTCRRNRCCSPRRSRTMANVQFRCPDNKLISERFMLIRSCECRATTNCPYTVQYDDHYDAADDD